MKIDDLPKAIETEMLRIAPELQSSFNTYDIELVSSGRLVRIIIGRQRMLLEATVAMKLLKDMESGKGSDYLLKNLISDKGGSSFSPTSGGN